MKERKLLFGNGNGKLGAWVATFSLPAGWSCPFAGDCLSKVNRKTGKMKDGPAITHRCFAASEESRWSRVRYRRWTNYDAVRNLSAEAMTAAVLAQLDLSPIVRIHVSGDYFSQCYFNGWLAVAEARPQQTFYFYTKSIPYWIVRLADVGTGHVAGRVRNFIPTASPGGRFDSLISEYGLRTATVWGANPGELANNCPLPLDHDDTHAQVHGGNFALLIHGTQPAGSVGGKNIMANRKLGEWGYGDTGNAVRKAKRENVQP